MPWFFSSPALACATLSLALLLALAIDHFFGEPRAAWHPVVWMGNFLGAVGRRIAPSTLVPGPDYKAFGLGALAWSAGAAMVLILSVALEQVVLRVAAVSPWGVALAVLVMGWALKPMLAWAMLRGEVLAVEVALGDSLAAGRARLAWLVSREVTTLTEAQVRESAIESLAENLNDSVVAPIFWFVLLGLPGAALYRFANTADAMWGYRGVRQGQVWEWAGKWAAWADDALSWLPARLTALLLWAVSGRAFTLTTLRAQAALTPSPNSGWPMAAMSLALDIRLRKPDVYTLNAPGRSPTAADTATAAVWARNTVIALIPLALTALVFIAKVAR